MDAAPLRQGSIMLSLTLRGQSGQLFRRRSDRPAAVVATRLALKARDFPTQLIDPAAHTIHRRVLIEGAAEHELYIRANAPRGRGNRKTDLQMIVRQQHTHPAHRARQLRHHEPQLAHHTKAPSRDRHPAKVWKNRDKQKGRPFRIALSEIAEAIMFGRHNWTRTNDPHHVKVTARLAYTIDFSAFPDEKCHLKNAQSTL